MTSYPFASASVKARETGLLKMAQLDKMMNAATPQEAYGALLETGYGADALAEQVKDFELTIRAEMEKAYAFVHSVFPDPRVEELFFLRFDYHNLKLLVKASMLEREAGEESLSPFGTISLATLKSAVLEKRYTSLTKEMERAMNDLTQRFAVREDVTLVDMTLDGAYARDIVERLEHVSDEAVRRYFEAYFDFTNVITTLRLQQMARPQDMLKKLLLPGGSIPERLFIQALPLDPDEQKALLASGGYAEAFRRGFEGLAETGGLEWFEKERSSLLNQILSEGAGDMFSLGPVLHYMNAKENEANCIRVILAGKLNQIPRETISRLCFEVM